MNKKLLLSIILSIIILSLVIFLVIKNNNKEYEKNEKDIFNNSKKEETDNNESINKNPSNKTLVVYFSMAGEVYNVGNVEVGNTALVASYMSDYLNADLFEIIPSKNYTRVYKDLIKVAKEEQKKNERPQIKNKIDNFEKYDTVFIGYPIWWGDLPQILYTFLEEYNFDNKTIIPFNTHEGSGSSGTYNTIKNKLTNANVNINGLSLQGKNARTDNGKEQTINWLKKLGY